MNRQQFLNELQNCLEGEVSQQIIYDNVSYYDQYFNEQISTGKSEEEVITELGKPALLAKTIIETSNVTERDYYDEQIFTEEEDGTVEPDLNIHTVEIKWYHKLLIAVIIVAIIVLLFTIAGVLITYAVPILIILLIVYFIRTIFSQ